LDASFQDEVSGQEIIARSVFTRNDDAGLNGAVLAKPCADFIRLDTVTANFDLVVGAAEKFEIAVGKSAREVAGFVEARAGIVVEWIWYEFFTSELGIVEVAAADTGSRNVQLAHRARGNLLQVIIEKENLGIGDWAPDRRESSRPRVRSQRAGKSHYGAFRGPVIVDEGEGQPSRGVLLKNVGAGEEKT
jgi:hypothetical protein